ncbi:ATP-dependent DNA helicase pfh1, partial [Frankliniella fusca]
QQVQTELEQLQQSLDAEDAEVDPDDPAREEGDDAAWEDVNEEEDMMADQETLLDDVEIISPDTGISIAPGENRAPTSLLFDRHVEELSFPTIYCGQARNVPSSVSITQIAKAEARMFDRRCARNVPKLFLSFCRLRRHKIAAQVTLALRKKRRRNNVTVRDMLNAATVEQLVQHNDGYKILQVDRSSPAYWERKKKTVFAMYRQFGLPSLFVTFSSAETRLVELLVVLVKVSSGRDISEEEARAMSWQEKVCLVQADPITVTRYLHRRFKELWKVMKSRGGPLNEYKMAQHFFRVEMQHRGSMHFHCLLWLDGAPLFDPADPGSEERCTKFIDELISCSLDNELGDLINVQFHRHSRTCRRQVGGRRMCRFGVPFPPMRCTRILVPFDGSVSEDVRKQLSTEYNALQQRMLALHKDSPDLSFDEFLLARPDVLEQCCLAEFAALYTFHTKRRSRSAPAEAEQADRHDEENEDDVDIFQEGEDQPQQVQVEAGQRDLLLKDKSGYVSRRAPNKAGGDNPRVIRYRNYSPGTDQDNFMREQLMLFSHWRDESPLSSNTRQLYAAMLDEIKTNRAKYVKLDINMEEVLAEVLRREECEDEEEGEDAAAVPQDFQVFEADDNLNADIGLDVAPDIMNSNVPQSDRFLLPHHIPEDEYLALVARLNERQRRYHLNLVHMLKTRPDEQMLHFVTGGAGVGKSALIKAITQSAIRVFVRVFQESPDHLTVAIMAPTGKAAFGVGGVTIASALKIFRENPNMTLGPDELNTLRTQLAHVRLFIIDEVSMVGRETFAQIDSRLRQIFNSQEPFGVSVLLLNFSHASLSPPNNKRQTLFHCSNCGGRGYP